MRMTEKEILTVYEQGPEAVVKLVQGLFDVIEKLNEIIENQNKKIDQLEKKVLELESRINKDSKNSSKPPSTDMFRRNQNNSREKSGKKPGGQPGHEPHRLELCSNPNKIVIHKATRCSCCRMSLKDIPIQRVERRQILDIPVIKIKVIEHQAEVKVCPVCNQTTKGKFPEKLQRVVQYGTGVYTFISACQNFLMIPYERTAEFFSYLFDHKISEGTLKNINERLYNTLEETDQKLKDAITRSEVVHQDETGIYISGERHWLHASSTERLTFYQNDKNRGQKAFDEIGIIPQFHGILIHDYWKPYLGYTDCSHYLCNAHHLRELKFIHEEFPHQKWAFHMQKLLKKAKERVDRAKQNGKMGLSRYLVNKYESLYDRIIIKAIRANPPNKERTTARGRIKQTVSRLLAERFRECKKMILGFIHDFKIPFDNNLVERDLRMMKLKQKVSGCFRSKEGADFFCRIRGYISSARKQGFNVFDALLSAFQGKPLLNF
ncbi:MAG TPA: IS66 family transposase [Ignavibacteriales bacterium]|nr:IS66 family transposase [Ignavibacteriales bacterium]